MNSAPRLKFFTWILLVSLLTVTVNGVHAHAHAVAGAEVVSGDLGRHADTFAPHHCPCSPVEQHQESDGCDSCVNCACHAPLASQYPIITYNPGILTMGISEPFRYLPEVFLSKFIPPQNLA